MAGGGADAAGAGAVPHGAVGFEGQGSCASVQVYEVAEDDQGGDVLCGRGLGEGGGESGKLDDREVVVRGGKENCFLLPDGKHFGHWDQQEKQKKMELCLCFLPHLLNETITLNALFLDFTIPRQRSVPSILPFCPVDKGIHELVADAIVTSDPHM